MYGSCLMLLIIPAVALMGMQGSSTFGGEVE